MEWEAAGIVIAASPYGEGDAVVTVLTEEHGAHRGLARGALARRNRAIWDIGNVVRVRWVARVSEQLGSFMGELVESPASRVMDDKRALGAIAAACATAAASLPDRAAVPQAFAAMMLLLARLVNGEAPIPAFVHWEIALLAELGFALDLTRCAVSGRAQDLGFVSPRTGRAVARAEAGAWRDKLLVLPGFLGAEGDDRPASEDDQLAGLRLTGHFLARDAFGQRHLAIPASRDRLVEMVAQGGTIGGGTIGGVRVISGAGG